MRCLTVGRIQFCCRKVIGSADHPCCLARCKLPRRQRDISTWLNVADREVQRIVNIDFMVERGQSERAIKVQRVRADIVLARVAGDFTELVMNIGGQATHVRRTVDDLVAPARIALNRISPARRVKQRHVRMQDQWCKCVRIAERIKQDRRQEMRREIATQRDRTEAAGQANIGIARPQCIAGKTPLASRVSLDETCQHKFGFQAAAEVFRSLETEPGGRHATAIEGGCAGGIATVAHGADIRVDNAADRDAGLRHGRTGESEA